MTCKGFGVLAMWIKSAQDFSCVQSLFKSLLQKKLMTLATKSIHYLTCSVFKYVYTAENSPGFHLVHCFEIYSIWCLYVTSVSPSTPLDIALGSLQSAGFQCQKVMGSNFSGGTYSVEPPPPITTTTQTDTHRRTDIDTDSYTWMHTHTLSVCLSISSTEVSRWLNVLVKEMLVLVGELLNTRKDNLLSICYWMPVAIVLCHKIRCPEEVLLFFCKGIYLGIIYYLQNKEQISLRDSSYSYLKFQIIAKTFRDNLNCWTCDRVTVQRLRVQVVIPNTWGQ